MHSMFGEKRVTQTLQQNNQTLIPNTGFDQNGGHHELRLEKIWFFVRFMLIFEPRRPISWTFLRFGKFWSFAADLGDHRNTAGDHGNTAGRLLS